MVSYKTPQPQNTFFAGRVAPNKESSIKLSGGRLIPYYYYLGVGSTVPFVELTGSGVSPKRLSWGEVVEVMPGQLLTVRNVSYHLGDIEIQSGNVPTVPKRITVPVEYTPLAAPYLETYTAKLKWPCDTRRAKNAYLYCQITAEGLPTVIPPGMSLQIHTRGQFQQHTTTEETPFRFNTNIDYSVGDEPAHIGLGYRWNAVQDASTVMCLPDFVDVYTSWTGGDEIPLEGCNYVLEY